MNRLKYLFYRLLSAVFPSDKNKYFKNYFKNYFKYHNNKIILISNGNKKILTSKIYIKNLNITWKGDNNIIEIEEFNKNTRLKVDFGGNNNYFKIGKNCRGNFNLTSFGDNSKIDIGKRVEVGSILIALHDNDSFTIGNNCMLSDSIICFTDGHSIIDKDSYELLNCSPFNVQIGSHVWIGKNVSLLKGASIPNNCVVAMNSTVTKRFVQENCVIAGNPARIVKENINWNGCRPSKYNKSNIDKNF